MSAFSPTIKRCFSVILSTAMILGMIPNSIIAAEETDFAESYDDSTLLVKLRSGGVMTYSARSGLENVESLELLFSPGSLSGDTVGRRRSASSTGAWYTAQLTEGANVEKTAEALAQDPMVMEVEFNHYVEIFDGSSSNSADLYASMQWYLDTCGVREGQAYLSEHFDMAGGSSDVVVALLDSGVNIDHVDLADNIWTNPGEIPDNGIDDDENGFVDDVHGWNFAEKNIGDNNNNVYDYNGHGTMCAGIIAGSRNGEGIEGVAYGVKIMPVRVNGASSTVGNVIRGLKYACDNGADIVNMSLGLTNNNAALRQAIEIYGNSAILVASAGNADAGDEGNNYDGWPIKPVNGYNNSIVTYPAAYPTVIGVMSRNRNAAENGDLKSGFSRWDPEPGDGVDYEFIAPGSDILSTHINTNPSMPLPGYDYGDGTSFSAPFVSGCFALLVSKYKGRSDYTPADLRQMMIDTAEPIQGITVASVDPDETESYTDVYSFSQPNVAKALAYKRKGATLYPQCKFSDGEPNLLPDGAVISEEQVRFTYTAEDGQVYTEWPGKDGRYVVTAEMIGQEQLYYYIENSQVSLTLTSTVGDYTGDNVVDENDLTAFDEYIYAQQATDPRFCQLADLDNDGVVGTKDLIILNRMVH